MSLTMLGDLAVFWVYVTRICSFTHYITLHTRVHSCFAVQHGGHKITGIPSVATEARAV